MVEKRIKLAAIAVMMFGFCEAGLSFAEDSKVRSIPVTGHAWAPQDNGISLGQISVDASVYVSFSLQ